MVIQDQHLAFDESDNSPMIKIVKVAWTRLTTMRNKLRLKKESVHEKKC